MPITRFRESRIAGAGRVRGRGGGHDVFPYCRGKRSRSKPQVIGTVDARQWQYEVTTARSIARLRVIIQSSMGRAVTALPRRVSDRAPSGAVASRSAVVSRRGRESCGTLRAAQAVGPESARPRWEPAQVDEERIAAASDTGVSRAIALRAASPHGRRFSAAAGQKPSEFHSALARRRGGDGCRSGSPVEQPSAVRGLVILFFESGVPLLTDVL